MWIYLWAFYSVPLIYISACARTILSWWLWFCSRAWSQASWCLWFHSSFSRLLWLLEVFCISIKIVKLLVLESVKNTPGSLIGIALSLQIAKFLFMTVSLWSCVYVHSLSVHFKWVLSIWTISLCFTKIYYFFDIFLPYIFSYYVIRPLELTLYFSFLSYFLFLFLFFWGNSFNLLFQLRSVCVCCCSVAESCLTLWNPTDCSMPGLPVLHYLPEFAQTHVHQVSDTIQPSHPLSPPSPLAHNLSQHQSLLQWVGSSHQVAKVLELQLQHQSSLKEGLICLYHIFNYSKIINYSNN